MVFFTQLPDNFSYSRYVIVLVYQNTGNFISLWPSNRVDQSDGTYHTFIEPSTIPYRQISQTDCVTHPWPRYSWVNVVHRCITDFVCLNHPTLSGSTYNRDVSFFFSLSDVTAILNCNAMWAYVITVLVTGERWLLRRVFSVAIAICGVLLIVYGGSSSTPGTQLPSRGPFTSKDIIGDVLTLIASVGFAISEVAYKIYIALPVEQGAEKPVLSLPTYERIADPDTPIIHTERIPSLESRTRASSFASLVASSTETTQSQYTPVEPVFGLHPNLITSCVGVCGLLFLWIPIPILHYFNVERWQLPPDRQTWIEVILLSICGCASNGGFMVNFVPPVLSMNLRLF